MVTKLTALGVPVALLALMLVLVAGGGTTAAPPTERDGGADATRSGGRGVDAVARLKDAEGDFVGVVRFHSDGDQVEVEADVQNVDVNPGQFHGFHVHQTGKCDPEAVDPATGSTVPFFSAGGHFNPGGSAHGDHAGDFPVLLVHSDGHAEEEGFDTDRFKLSQLFDEDRSAVIVHAGRDNYANVPAATPTGAKRYHSHAEGVFGPDSVTKATGDAGARFACGVVRRP
jgi:superoxide dismutase, Cu-Zn family